MHMPLGARRSDWQSDLQTQTIPSTLWLWAVKLAASRLYVVVSAACPVSAFLASTSGSSRLFAQRDTSGTRSSPDPGRCPHRLVRPFL